MSDVINAHDLGVAGGYIIEAAMQGDIDQLKAENSKLRELLQRTWDAFHDATAREFVTVKNELRELGVDVDAE